MATNNIKNAGDRPCPKKSWGWEEWIVNNDLYCGKRLHFTTSGGCTSLHFHMNKHETMFVERGTFIITIVNPTTAEKIFNLLMPGDSIEITRGLVHRITATELEGEEAVLVEFSTHHEDSDSYRVER